MTADDWKDRLRIFFESIDVLELCKHDTRENFKQFCEFIAEPAFEALAEEMKTYKIKSKFWTRKGSSTGIQFEFVSGGVDSFHYVIVLPRNSVQLKLRLQLKGRKSPNAALEESEEAFMEKVPPDRVLKISKEDLLSDIVERFRNYTYAVMTSAK
ncbi:MAG: hypothetical protein H6P98_2436 [Candidatus Aminicenantes bacterium]|nr:hypothetical protein [Candidatus Aminicenantes bacterium]